MLRDIRVLLDQKYGGNLNAMVTFTDVEISNDLKYATIFYSVLGKEDDRKKVFWYLKKITKRVKGELGDLLGIRHTPEIKFEFDPSIERGMKIEKLLNEISHKDDKGSESNT
jgi:ribosome-binding factor A